MNQFEFETKDITVLYNDISFCKSAENRKDITCRTMKFATIEEAEQFKARYDRITKNKDYHYIEIFKEYEEGK